MPVENVLEVAELGALTPVPGAGAGVLGVRNFNGQVLPVFDLRKVLGTPDAGHPRRLLVTEHEGCLGGFAVDGVTNVAPLEGPSQATDVDYLTHATIEEGKLVGVVDLARVFSALVGGSA